jgi:hypothetical protein
MITPQQGEEMRARLERARERARRKLKGENPLQPLAAEVVAQVAQPPIKKRIRQSAKPLMNKLEQEFFKRLETRGADCSTFPLIGSLRAQALKFKIANNAFYKPDITGFCDGRLHAWEVKGNKGKNIDRGKLALKVAASAWPEVVFILAWKTDGQWNEQRILP